MVFGVYYFMQIPTALQHEMTYLTILIGSVLFAVGATSSPPVTTPMYILMATGYGFLAFGDGSLRIVQASIVSHCFPEATLIPLAVGMFGYVGEGINFYITPVIAQTRGLQLALWLGPVSCGFGVLCAAALVLLLYLKPPEVADDSENKQMLTLKVLRGLPGSYWLLIPAIGFTAVGWIAKQSNLPDYLELRHGYTMSEASRVTGIASFIFLLSPLVCWVLNKVACDGILFTFLQVWMMSLYALLGFCPSVNIIVISLADAIGVGMILTMISQLIVTTSPALYVGTLAGLVFMVRNLITALTFIASGYMLQRNNMIDKDEALRHYQHFFLMLIILSTTGIIFGVLMNVVDIRKGSASNSRIRNWQQSNVETIGLISMDKSSNKYCGNNDAKESDDYSTNGM